MRKPKVNKSIAVTLSLALGLAIIVFVTMLLFNVTDFGITIASFGATIFMLLSKNNLKKRTIFGSYVVATIIGFIFSNLSDMKSFNLALAAVSSILIMTFLNLQHAPAIGISIAMVLNKFSFWTDFIILFCIFFILAMTILLKIFLKDPTKVITFVDIEEEKIKWKFQKRDIPEYLKLKSPVDSDD